MVSDGVNQQKAVPTLNVLIPHSSEHVLKMIRTELFREKYSVNLAGVDILLADTFISSSHTTALYQWSLKF